jgi:hypothetical protein
MYYHDLQYWHKMRFSAYFLGLEPEIGVLSNGNIGIALIYADSNSYGWLSKKNTIHASGKDIIATSTSSDTNQWYCSICFVSSLLYMNIADLKLFFFNPLLHVQCMYFQQMFGFIEVVIGT